MDRHDDDHSKLNDDISIAFLASADTMTCRICKMEFTVLVWSDALRAGFCNPCFDNWYERITKWLRNREMSKVSDINAVVL